MIKKPDWEKLQAKFDIEQAATGIGVRVWCEKQGLNYSTARKYIKAGNGRRKASGVPFKKGHQHGVKSTKFGAYSRYFPIEIMQDVAASQGLPDELMLARARIHNLMRSLEQIQKDIEGSDDAEQREALYKTMLSAEGHLSRYINQVESIHRTLINNNLGEASTLHKQADIYRVKEQAAMLKVSREKLQREGGDTETPLSDAVRDIQQANAGLMTPQ